MVQMVTNGDTGRQLAEHGLTSVETISSNRPRPNFSGWVRRDTARQLDEFAAALVVARRRWTAKVNGEPDRPRRCSGQPVALVFTFVPGGGRATRADVVMRGRDRANAALAGLSPRRSGRSRCRRAAPRHRA